MPKFVDIEPLDRKFEERYLDYRNRSQSEQLTGKFRVDDTLTTAAMIMESCLDSLREAPAVDVAPVRHGKWLHIHQAVVDTTGDCSACDTEAVWRTRNKPYGICPNCGAKMDG